MLTVKISKAESRHIVIEYENNLDLAAVEISKGDLRVKFLRWLSDFRDISLSKTSFGSFIIDLYYGKSLNKFGLLTIVIPGVFFSAFFAIGVWYLIGNLSDHKSN